MAGSGVFPKTSSGSGGTDLIYKNDYNTIQTAVAAVKTTYYGVECTSSQIGAGTTIIPNITEWNNLRADINSCVKHITGSDSAIGSRTSGQLITASNTNAYKTAAEYIETNKNTVYASTQLANFANSDNSSRNGSTNPWNSNITYQVRTTFSSSADAAYFFQSGGYFVIQLTSTTGGGGTKNTNWASVINSVSNWTYTLADYTAGNKSNTYNVTSYSSSALTVSCVKESATSLLFTCYFNDATGGDPDELIDNYITATWGYYRSTDAIVTAYPATINKTIDLTSGGLAPVATYSFGTMPTSINEGSAGTINVNTTNVSNGTTLYWTVTNAGDFGTSSGSFVVNSNAGSFTVTPTADTTTEGAETFAVSIRTGSTSGTVVATSSAITINDTSQSAAPTYAITKTYDANEGSNALFAVSTTNVANGTTLYWTVNNGTTVNADFVAASGSVTINSNAGSVSIDAVQDFVIEGDQTFTVSLRTGSTGGPIVATSGSATVFDDTYTTFTWYAINPTSVDEGNYSTYFRIVTDGVNAGTTLYWTLNNGSTADADFTSAGRSGSWVVNATNPDYYDIYPQPVADTTTEGAQTFTISIRTGSITGTVISTSPTITINDTSLSAPTYFVGGGSSSVGEGFQHTFYVDTTDVPNGTTLYWTILNGTTSNADFASTSGSFSITSNQGQFPVLLSADGTSESTETFQVQVRTGSTSGTVVATSNSRNILDDGISATPAILTNFIESNYNAGLEATFIQAYTQIAFLTTGTSRATIGNSGSPETRSILPGEWLTTSPTAVSTTTAGLFDIELTPSAATLAIEGDNTVFGLRTYSTGSSWNTRIQLGTNEVFRYLLVDFENELGGPASHDATAIFTATIYLHGTNTVQTSTAITMYSRAGTVDL